MKKYFIILFLIIGFSAQAKDTASAVLDLDAELGAPSESDVYKNPEDGRKLDSIKLKNDLQQYLTTISEQEFHARKFESYKELLKHNEKVYKWQQFSSVIIFIVVVIIVLGGFVFAGMQFYISLKKVKIAEAGGTPSEPEPMNEVKLSLQGIEVRSSLLGIVILVISIAFFYLYLVYVYPVNEKEQPNLKVNEIERRATDSKLHGN